MASKRRWCWVLALGVVLAASGCDGDGGSASTGETGETGDTGDTGDTGERTPELWPDDDAWSGGPDDATAGDDDVVADDDAGPADTEDVADEPDPEPEPQSFSVRASVEQIYVWNAPPDAGLELLAPSGELVAEVDADYLGSYIFRELEPGDGYAVRLAADPADMTNPLDVMSVDGSLPPESFYADQVLEPGFGYITMRDGTTLSVFVSLPGPVEDGPYPTLVNYSGYSPSEPGRVLADAVEPFCGDYPVLCDAPSHGAGLFGGIFGYASVGVNMRGTGCSGGAYDYFEPLQLLDGYDAIEIVAHQSWVKHNKVGMGGLSYPGISQLFVARTNPPGLAAITPMSVLADTATSTLAPGGIYNLGFALAWIDNVVDKALPYGHKWLTDLVNAGDTVCEENQLLHAQAVDGTEKALANPYYTDEVAEPLDPSSWAGEIEVPVWLTGQWQDEQTGPHFPALFDKFTGTDVARFTVTNGVHVDGFAPQALVEWKNFLDLYVAREVPVMGEQLESLLPIFFVAFLGAEVELPDDRLSGYETHAEALAAYEAEPPVRVIFETGARETSDPGAPEGTFERHFESWPIPSTVAHRLYMHGSGTLAPEPSADEDSSSDFHPDPTAGGRTTLPSGSISDLQPKWVYPPLAEDKAIAFIGAPLEEDLVMIGHGSVDLWLRSTAVDADLEVILTEVRPDGQESHVQSGWLRASQRALRDDATELRPVKTHYEADVQPLVPGEWTQARVELMAFAHIFRAGSRLRLSVDTPGDSCASWHFILLEDVEATDTHTIGHDAARPSSVALPVVPDVDVPTALPPCNWLRGQPCRDYVPLSTEPPLP